MAKITNRKYPCNACQNCDKPIICPECILTQSHIHFKRKDNPLLPNYTITTPKSCDNCKLGVDKPPDICNICLKSGSKWIPMDEVVISENGAKQSKSNYLWIDFHPEAMLRIAKLSSAGCKKYGKDNWKDITVFEHLNHAITHIFMYFAGDKEEDHLTHAAWRVIAALGVSIDKGSEENER